MIACEKRRELEVIPPYKIVVVRTYILNFLTHCPPRVVCKQIGCCKDLINYREPLVHALKVINPKINTPPPHMMHESPI